MTFNSMGIMGALITAASKAYVSRAKQLIAVSALLVIPTAAAWLVERGLGIGKAWPIGLAGWFWFPWVSLALIRACDDALSGQHKTLYSLLDMPWQSVWQFIKATVFLTVAMGLALMGFGGAWQLLQLGGAVGIGGAIGLLVAVPCALTIVSRTMLYEVVIALEGPNGAWRALAKSWQLTGGAPWFSVAVVLVSLLPGTLLLGVILLAQHSTGTSWQWAIQGISWAGTVILAPAGTLMLIRLYRTLTDLEGSA